MKWMKKWAYLLLLAGMGAVYLSVVDGWQVYAEPLDRVKAVWQEVRCGEQVLPVDSGQVVSGAGNTDERETEAGENASGMHEQEAFEGTFAVSGGDHGMAAEDGFGNGGEPVYMTVEDDYFADAVFIGDSRTVGLYEYGGLEEITTFYASKGLTIYKIFDSPVVEADGQKQKLTIEEALQQNSYKKIYLMIGINEMGTGTVETFAQRYEEVAAHLLELQPDAILYIQGIMKVTTERSEQGDYINNEGIVARNEALAGLADNKRIFYLDVNDQICDDTGGMEPSYTFDGVHLKAQYIEIWVDYLKSHAIDLKY